MPWVSRLVRRELPGMPSVLLKAAEHRALIEALQSIRSHEVEVSVGDRHLVLCSPRLTVALAVEFDRVRRYRDFGAPTLRIPFELLRRALGWVAAETGARPITDKEFVGLVHDESGLRFEIDRRCTRGRFPLSATPRAQDQVRYRVSPRSAYAEMASKETEVAIWCGDVLAIGPPDQSDVLVIARGEPCSPAAARSP